jgi:hypothetical protein
MAHNPQNTTPILQATGSLLYEPIVFVYVVIYAKLQINDSKTLDTAKS